MRIAMLCHNAITNDARIIKEARTLVGVGHTVEVHGRAADGNASEFSLPGTEIRVFLVGANQVATSGSLDMRSRTLRQRSFIVRLLALTLVVSGFLLASHLISKLMSTVGISMSILTSGLILVLVCAAFVAVCYVWVKAAYVGFETRLSRLFSLVSRLSTPAGFLRACFLSGSLAVTLGITTALLSLTNVLGQVKPGVSLEFAITATTILAGAGCLVARLDRAVWPRLRAYVAARFGATAILTGYEKIAALLVDSVATRPKPDVVHIHDIIALSGASALQARIGCPLVWDAHEIYEDLAIPSKSRTRVAQTIIARAQHLLSHFITINESIANFYAEHYPNLPKATVVMNATDVQVVPRYDGRMHDAAGLPRTQKILLFQGGFAKKRGLEALVEAAGELSFEWTLVLMGWGNLETVLRAKAAQLPARDTTPRVVFLPGVPHAELADWTAGATLGAIPYENTGLNHLYCTPNKLWEYPSARVPILCTDLVEMRRVIDTYDVGITIARDFTSCDIARAVNGLDNDRLVQLRENCERFISVDNWSVYGAMLRTIYANEHSESLRGEI